MVRTNMQRLVEQSVIGTITQPRLPLKNPYIVDPAGRAHILPGTGGITYNVKVGDPAFDFEGDHVEPGVSISYSGDDDKGLLVGGLNILSCVGNEARVVSGAAAGSRGVVTGKHGGVEHVLIDFPSPVLDNLMVGDKIQVRAVGQGLALTDYGDIQVMNCDPALFQKLGIAVQNKQLVVPVTHVIPSSIMGSGIGSKHSFSGDYDIQMSDREIVQKYGLQNLRLGDLIAIRDADCRYGRAFRSGAMSVGVVVHGTCLTSGHGPGVTVLMTTLEKLIVPKIEPGANIADYLNISRDAKRTGPKRRRRR
ncbi:MAG TPA: DUF4438 domain-containing protein [Candidatus Eisenbacteria bacterium]|uniref:DUF4438 domain-containing protein n=1 Tax=Eiseniibacteriota bacterium TaxID=2212470 RepID=A0A7V2F3B2_UNCEI|nr:DUF4438 domain-containing protein [Candidatus Eisenbacteria bacterium]